MGGEDYRSREVKLTVVDNNGFEDSTTSMVYVNYRGVWKEFVIDRSHSRPDNYDMGLSSNLRSGKDRIRYMRANFLPQGR